MCGGWRVGMQIQDRKALVPVLKTFIRFGAKKISKRFLRRALKEGLDSKLQAVIRSVEKKREISTFSTHKPLTTNMWAYSPFQPILQLCRQQLGILQFSSDTNYPELGQASQVKESVPRHCPHFRCQSQIPSCHDPPPYI